MVYDGDNDIETKNKIIDLVGTVFDINISKISVYSGK